MRKIIVTYRVVVSVFLLLGGAMASAQQALLVSPGGVVSFDGTTIATHDKVLSADEMTFRVGEYVYPNGGPVYFEMLANNPAKYNVADRVGLKNGEISFDGKPVVVGVRVDRVEKALRWGAYVAAIVVIHHKASRMFEPDRAFAVVIFSPESGKGGFRELYLAGGKVPCDLWLLDPVGKAQ